MMQGAAMVSRFYVTAHAISIAFDEYWIDLINLKEGDSAEFRQTLRDECLVHNYLDERGPTQVWVTWCPL